MLKSAEGKGMERGRNGPEEEIDRAALSISTLLASFRAEVTQRKQLISLSENLEEDKSTQLLLSNNRNH